MNFHYLLQAIKSNKFDSYFFSSSIIKNEYFVLTKIIQNIKLIEYIIKGKLIKINKEEEKDNNLIENRNKIIDEKENSFIDASIIHANWMRNNLCTSEV